MHLGIAQQSGLIYEGVNAPDLPSIPLPTVTQAKLIESEADWNKLPNHLLDMPMSWVFRALLKIEWVKLAPPRRAEEFGTGGTWPQSLLWPASRPCRCCIS